MRHTITALTAIAAQGAVAEIISYWGNGGYDQADGSLAQWCAQNEHIDIINLAFLNTFGSGQYPQGTINNCQINGDGSSSGCEQLESDIGTCQSLGKKIFIALGGGGGSPALNSDNDAKGVAYSLWNSYANPNVVASGTPRPLGNARLDGWDIDIESDPNSENENGYLATMLNTLRNYFSDDPNNSYYISGAPQCVIPDANMGNSIANAQYDYLNIQFYNNPCGASTVYKDPNDNPDGVGNFNLADWPGYISGGASANAKLLVGMPGNTAEDGPGAAGDYDFVDASDLPKVYDASKGVQGFSGFMIYEVGDTTSDGDLNGCDYFQTLYSVYTTGNTC